MKLKKLILPMMAFVFAIGMAFATVDLKPDLEMIEMEAQDYVLTPDGVVAIAEINCGMGEINCEARLAEGEPAYPVFDDQALKNRKKGSGQVVELY
ncbi:DUF6520 family protein [Salegentibacter sp. LM13S]|uniref:DUF6520 family protein n=1 Tax=Salegentibacter lacus TaxID=2873599 RepID=UPI001CCAFAEB|nr:DUF6520 family protein [Salegentibacter lacus]MBZ9629143.1 DUF6520 family protein [Salegentibacter lacus]